jgi:NAD-dependent deacetylase
MRRGSTVEEKIFDAARILVESVRTVASTGAGISRESGIATFRDSDGLWKRYRPEEIASREGFLSDPGLVWRWYRDRLLTAREKEPNPGHYALAEIERILARFVLITQNVDNLHRRAGSTDVIELHGNIERYRCIDHSHPVDFSEEWGDTPPRCRCGSLVRPDVVWFGETLPPEALSRAFEEASRCDAFLLVGTSCVVQPAALLPAVAKNAGASLIEVNVAPSEATYFTDIFLEGRSGEILPMLVEAVKKMRTSGS